MQSPPPPVVLFHDYTNDSDKEAIRNCFTGAALLAVFKVNELGVPCSKSRRIQGGKSGFSNYLKSI